MKFLILGLGALLFVAGTAHAEFQKEWIFDCHYSGPIGKVNTNCRILANVCTFRKDMAEPQGCIDYLIAQCGNEVFFRGEAEHLVHRVETPSDKLDYQVIAGLPNESYTKPPMFRYSTLDPMRANPFHISSWLKVEEDIVMGFCTVHHPVDHR